MRFGFDEAGHGGGVESEEAESVVEGCVGEGEEVFEGAVEGEDTAGEDTVGHGSSVGDLDVEAAELVSAIGHSGGAHGVGDEDGAVAAFHLPPDFYDFRGDVDAVADELGEEGIVGEDGGKDAGHTMVEGTHGVEGMGCADGSGGDGGGALVGGCVGVANGNANAAGDGVGGEFGGAGKFGGESDEASVAFAGVNHLVESGDVWLEKMRERLNTATGVGEERTFKVDADGAGFCGIGGRIEKLGKGGERSQGDVHGCGNGGGKVTAGAARGEKAADCGECDGSCLHDVVASCAVEVDVEECGGERVAGEVDALVGEGLGGGNARGDA